MGSRWYVLNPDKTVRPAKRNGGSMVPTAEEFALIYDPITKIVGKDTVGNTTVSTVFLGLDHSVNAAVPILFETVLFDQEGHGYNEERYCTYQEALEGHQRRVRLLLEEHNKTPIMDDPEFSLDEIEAGKKLVGEDG